MKKVMGVMSMAMIGAASGYATYMLMNDNKMKKKVTKGIKNMSNMVENELNNVKCKNCQ